MLLANQVVNTPGMSLKRSASESSNSDDETKAAMRAAKRRLTQESSLSLGISGIQGGSIGSPPQQQPTMASLQALNAFAGGFGGAAANPASQASSFLGNLRMGAPGARPGLAGTQQDAHSFLSPSLATANRTLTQEQISAILGGGFSASPRPALAAHASMLGSSLDSDTQALLAASRIRQAQAGLPSIAMTHNYSSMLPSLGGASALGLSSLANLGAGSATHQAAARQSTLESQLRAAQILALQSQMSSTNQVDQTRMLVMQQQQQQQRALANGPRDPPSSALQKGSDAMPLEMRPKESPTMQSLRPPSPKKQPPTETFLAVAGALPPSIPPAVEGSTPHYDERAGSIISMSTDEDQNWLSEFQCFIRSEILEVFRASTEDVQIRNNSKTLQKQQIGIRCRFCAHLPPSARASRSSAFPSSIPQIYQSFTMMLRDHWTACQSIPSPQKEKFAEFKTKNNQGASDSKNYWMHAARRTGMVNTSQGIDINDASRAAAARIPPFGTNSDTTASLALEKDDTAPLVLPEDKKLLQDQYWYALLQQVQRVRLSASERVGNRKSLKIGLPGFGCRYCCQEGRLGLSRIFPARRRTLPSKIPDIHDHLRRCPLCPQSVKDELEALEEQRKQNERDETEGKGAGYSAGKEKEFFTRIWSRLGHGNKPEPS